MKSYLLTLSILFTLGAGAFAVHRLSTQSDVPLEYAQVTQLTAGIHCSITDATGAPYTQPCVAYLRFGDHFYTRRFTPGPGGAALLTYSIHPAVADTASGASTSIKGALSVWPAHSFNSPATSARFWLDPQEGIASFASVTLAKAKDSGPPSAAFYEGGTSLVMAEPPHFGDLVINGLSGPVSVYCGAFTGTGYGAREHLLRSGRSLEISGDGVFPVHRWGTENGASVVLVDQSGAVIGESALRRGSSATINATTAYLATVQSSATSSGALMLAITEATVPAPLLPVPFPASVDLLAEIQQEATSFMGFKQGPVNLTTPLVQGTYRFDLLEVNEVTPGGGTLELRLVSSQTVQVSNAVSLSL